MDYLNQRLLNDNRTIFDGLRKIYPEEFYPRKLFYDVKKELNKTQIINYFHNNFASNENEYNR